MSITIDNVTVRDFSKICRTCLSSYNLKPISEFSNYIEFVLHKYTQIKFDPEDDLPKLICSNCVKNLTNAYTFLNYCDVVNQALIDCYGAEGYDTSRLGYDAERNNKSRLGYDAERNEKSRLGYDAERNEKNRLGYDAERNEKSRLGYDAERNEKNRLGYEINTQEVVDHHMGEEKQLQTDDQDQDDQTEDLLSGSNSVNESPNRSEGHSNRSRPVQQNQEQVTAVKTGTVGFQNPDTCSHGTDPCTNSCFERSSQEMGVSMKHQSKEGASTTRTHASKQRPSLNARVAAGGGHGSRHSRDSHSTGKSSDLAYPPLPLPQRSDSLGITLSREEWSKLVPLQHQRNRRQRVLLPKPGGGVKWYTFNNPSFPS